MKKGLPPPLDRGPALRVVPFGPVPQTRRTASLSDLQREQLARIAARLHLPARMMIYGEGAAAHWVFAVAEGAVKCYRRLPGGKRVVTAFLGAGDLFGLAEHGAYVNAAQAISPVVIYRLPVDELTVLLKHDPDLQFEILGKVMHELRESQRRAVILTRPDGAGRLAMFLASMSTRWERRPGHEHEVSLPMSREDIADYLALSRAGLQRAVHELEGRGLVVFEHRHAARILDSQRFAKFIATF
jgi:CRP-like cAMP-binding protein